MGRRWRFLRGPPSSRRQRPRALRSPTSVTTQASRPRAFADCAWWKPAESSSPLATTSLRRAWRSSPTRKGSRVCVGSISSSFSPITLRIASPARKTGPASFNATPMNLASWKTGLWAKGMKEESFCPGRTTPSSATSRKSAFCAEDVCGPVRKSREGGFGIGPSAVFPPG